MTAPHIDLCSKCVIAVMNRIYPTRAYGTGVEEQGTEFNFISVNTATKMMEGTITVTGAGGESLPMVAMITVDGTRLCALHSHVRRGRDYSSAASRGVPGYGQMDCD